MENTPNCFEDLGKVRNIEGFPLGEDEDICALSNPPYYTAYPNPHIAAFIAEHGTPYDEETDDYHREPFVSDVSEGKGGAIYNAHTYHTKVPHKAIIPFIEHYTEPNDIIYDGFCGSGMTGVAAQTTGRRAIMSDLSPVAAFIALNLNAPVKARRFEREAKRILNEVESECGWMYETWHPYHNHPERVKGRINYTVWSDVFLCPYCQQEVVYYTAAADRERQSSGSTFPCPHCGAETSTRSAERVMVREVDPLLNEHIEQVKRVPVEIFYSVDGKDYSKSPDGWDLALIENVEGTTIPYWHPTERMPVGDEARRNDTQGMTHIHHFYTKRNLWALASLWERAKRVRENPILRARLMFWVQALAIGQTHQNRYFESSYSQVNRYLKGTLYVGPKKSEVSPQYAYPGKIRQIARAAKETEDGTGLSNFVISVNSATAELIPENSVDYIFTDPPFGSNIMYSDLNFIWEAWLGVKTNNRKEAVVSTAQEKELRDYHKLMLDAFAAMYRSLKPSRWITVVFHNSKASVWNAIQDSLSRAGFIVAQVVTLDKKQQTMQQMTSTGAVKNDLVINAYKPHQQFEKRFLKNAGAGQESAFVAQHLEMLHPVADVERTREMLYSKMLAYYIQRGYEINMNSTQFYRMLGQEFVERDGYWFRDEAQAQEYEQRKLDPAQKRKGQKGQGVLFVSDERSAIAWLHQFLGQGPRSYSDVYTAYAKALQASEDQIPELKILLEETCVQVNGHWKRPDALTAEELEERRRQRLLRQFDEYLRQARTGQSLNNVRKEAILTGFEEAYRDKRFGDIVKVGEKLDQRVIDSSTEIFDFIDIAETKMM